MTFRRGISILDLLPIPDDDRALIPPEIAEQFQLLTVIDHHSTTSDVAFIHYGTVEAASDIANVKSDNWPVQIPGIASGLPFRLLIERAPLGSGQNLEPDALGVVLDLFLSPVKLRVPGFRGARRVIAPAVPTHLEPDPANPNVYLVGSGILRMTLPKGQAPTWQLIDSPDPFDPSAESGPVVDVTFQPPHFLFGGSQIGLTVDDLLIDDSLVYTPPAILARGQDEAWTGISIKDASLYFPPNTPLLGSLSIGMRDVLIGSGMQGEGRIEFGLGADEHNHAGVAVTQKDQPGNLTISDDHVTLVLAAGATKAQVTVQFTPPADPKIYNVYYTLPDGTKRLVPDYFNGPIASAVSTDPFTVSPGDVFKYRARVGAPTSTQTPPKNLGDLPEGLAELREVTLKFVAPPAAATDASAGPAPKINVRLGHALYNNVAEVRGPLAGLAGISFEADPAPTSGTLNWHFGKEAVPRAGIGVTYAPPSLPTEIDSHELTLTWNGKTRTVRVTITNGGPVLVGVGSDASGKPNVVSPGAAPSLVGVTKTYDLAAFDRDGTLTSSEPMATLAGSALTVSAGTVASVTVETTARSGTPPTGSSGANSSTTMTGGDGGYVEATLNLVHSATHLFDYDQDVPREWRTPDGGPDNAGDPATWARAFRPRAGAGHPLTFVVIGRADDLSARDSVAGNNNYNAGLAQRRARATAKMLRDAVPSAVFYVEGEQDPTTIPQEAFAEAASEQLATRNSAPGTNPRAILVDSGGHIRADGSRIEGWPPNDSVSDRDSHQRPDYRRCDVYALWGDLETSISSGPAGPGTPIDDGGAHSASTNGSMTAAVRTDVLVPGADGPSNAVVNTRDQSPPLNYLVRLRAKWDSPVLVSRADAVPTLLELVVEVQAKPIPVPAGVDPNAPAGQKGTVAPPTQQDPGPWRFVGKWTYDARSGESLLSVSLAIPDGRIAPIQNGVIATMLAFAPPLAAGLDPANVDGDAARVDALLAAAVVLAAFATNQSKVEFHRFELDYQYRGSTKMRFVCDYTVTLFVDVSLPGDSLRHVITGDKLQLKYKNVGIEFDWTPAGFTGVSLVYDDLSVEVANPGAWKINGPLGNIIRVTNSRVGTGSTWAEFDLAFALDLGVIRLDGATIRVTLTPPLAFEVRGLTVTINIPGTLKGSGSLTMNNSGMIRGSVDLTIVPTKLRAWGSLSFGQSMVVLQLGVRLPVGIPLASTGLGLFGFMGRFVANGNRDLSGAHQDDPVQREIDWYCKETENKYQPQQGQYALGVGAVIGSLPDGGTSFNAEGTLTIAFPDVSVVFGIDCHFMQAAGQAKETGTSSGQGGASSLRILGLVVFDPSAVILAVRGSYDIPKVLELRVPISAYFPLRPGDADPAPLQADAYLRVGSDGIDPSAGDPTHNGYSRAGDPIQAKILPGSLNVQAHAFVMFEEKRLHNLGNRGLDFEGFSVGFGAGFGLNWSAGPFRLSASVEFVVGLGTRPFSLAGVMELKGEISLVIISLSLTAEIDFLITDAIQHLHGHFCAEIDLFFFTLSGCVDIDIGDGGELTEPPPPPSPLCGVDLIDRVGTVRGHALAGGAADDGHATVWPDTVPVLHFSHYVTSGLDPASAFANPTLPEPAGPDWSGTTDLKFAYRITSVDLVQTAGAPGHLPARLDSSWWLPSHRPALVAPDPNPPEAPASGEEGRDLALLTWHPAEWARVLGDDNTTCPGDPAISIARVCDPTPAPKPVCALGQNARVVGLARMELAPDRPSPPPFSSSFTVHGGDALGAYDPHTAAELGAFLGVAYEPGTVLPLVAPVTLPGEGGAITGAFSLAHTVSAGRFYSTVPFEGVLAPALVGAELVLAMCLAPGWDEVFRNCDSALGDVKPGTPHGPGFVYQPIDPQQPFLNAPDAIQLGAAGVQVALPAPGESVTITAGGPGGIQLTAFDAKNNKIGQASSDPAGAQQTIQVTAPGIVKLTIAGGGGKGQLSQVCLITVGAQAVSQLVGPSLPTTSAPYPTVTGYDLDGKPTVWTPADITEVQGGGGVCQIVRFSGPSSPQQKFRIEAWPRSFLEILSVCGVTVDAQALHDRDQASRRALAVNLSERAREDASSRRNLLQPNSTYQLRVGWQWQFWRKSDAQPQPPPVGDSWRAGGTDVYQFHTAADGSLPDPAPPDSPPVAPEHFLDQPADAGPGMDESVFDPRGLDRYLLGFSPNNGSPPQFLDDPLSARLSADYLRQLAGLYQRNLNLRLRPTDAAPGSAFVAGAHSPANWRDVAANIEWRRLEAGRRGSDERMAAAASQAGTCVTGVPNLGGGTEARVTAALAPETAYDLLLVAPLASAPAEDDPVIGRAHFVTSRYRGPADLIGALGFDVTGLSPLRPHDAILRATLPAPDALALGNDRLLDDTLRAAGLDPWPLPGEPRTTALFILVGGSWRLAGILLEGLEPIDRPGRLALDYATVNDIAAGEVAGTERARFTPACSNAAATRVLLLPIAAATLPLASPLALMLHVDQPTRPAGPSLVAGREIYDRPRAAVQEGL